MLSDLFVSHAVVMCTCDRAGSSLRTQRGSRWHPQPHATTKCSASAMEWWWLPLGMRARHPHWCKPNWICLLVLHRAMAWTLSKRLQGTSLKSWWPSNIIFSVNPEEKVGFPSICWNRVIAWVSLMLCGSHGCTCGGGTDMGAHMRDRAQRQEDTQWQPCRCWLQPHTLTLLRVTAL